jgi:hypothetical protein
MKIQNRRVWECQILLTTNNSTSGGKMNSHGQRTRRCLLIKTAPVSNRFASGIIAALLVFTSAAMFGSNPLRKSAEKGPALGQATVIQTIELSSSEIKALFSPRGLTHLSSPRDTQGASVIGRSGTWGQPLVRYRIGPGDWLNLYQGETRFEQTAADSVVYTDFISGMPLKMTQTFRLSERGLDWDIAIETMMEFPVTIGDLALPLPWQRPGGEDPSFIFEKCFTKHHYIAGHGSFLHFTRPSGNPPFLAVMTKPGTKLEYFDNVGNSYAAFIHSGLSGGRVENGTWRQPHTYAELGPAGSANSRLEYGFHLEWADSWDGLREALFRNGLFDIRVVPGMTVPEDLVATISLRTKNSIEDVEPEFPDLTSVRFLGEKDGHFLFEIEFRRLGENKLLVRYGDDQTMVLEFFVTEPLETLFKKRSAFIVNSQQHRVPGKWYDGLFSVYDMKNGVLRGPENTDGFDFWWGYVLACDDPALCKAPYVAAKNVFFPVKEEIAAVEYYLKNFVWGGLQRTDKEIPYPYGIFGTPNWKVNRDPLLRAGVKDRNLDKMNVWRSYDYPHMIMLYYHMYQIASMYSGLTDYLDALGYLERAWQTARAYFTYPYEILPWYETYKWGCYDELVIVDLIAELEKAGRREEADWLRGEWEIKVKYFVYDDKYPYRSEYSIDRTAFESSYALARYGATRDMTPDKNLWWDKKLEKWYSHPAVSRRDAREFMDRQHNAGLAVRGWLETKYFLLGSDFTSSSDRHCLSYMAKMGGWSILDYGIRFAPRPYDWLQLGYASYLSSWALMNTGKEETDYGYWAPGKENDGATGWAFMSAKFGRAWIRKDVPRGAWHYDGEADLGYGSAVRTAAVVLTDDPLFDWYVYGGTLKRTNGRFEVIPRDGLRVRLFVAAGNTRYGIEFNRDGWKREEPVIIAEDLERITGLIENRTADSHTTLVSFWNIDPREWTLLLDGRSVPLRSDSEDHAEASLSIDRTEHRLELRKK